MAITSSASADSHTPKTTPHPSPTVPPQPHSEIHCVKCDSCGFTEDCTTAYISRLRHSYNGRWLCGLCIEAVKHELHRSHRLISTEEALNRHITFCTEFRRSSSSPSLNQTEHPISALGRVLRRRLDSPRRTLRTNSVGSLPPVDDVSASAPSLVRSGSCFPSLSR